MDALTSCSHHNMGVVYCCTSSRTMELEESAPTVIHDNLEYIDILPPGMHMFSETYPISII